MTMVLELGSEVEAVLAREAEQQGTTPELLAAAALYERFVASAFAANGAAKASKPAQMLEEEQASLRAQFPFIGKFHSGKGNLSQNTGEQYGDIVAEKHRNRGSKI